MKRKLSYRILMILSLISVFNLLLISKMSFAEIIIADPIVGGPIGYIIDDQKGIYPEHNDANLDLDIIVNPFTNFSSPSLSQVGAEEISKKRSLEYEEGYLTKYVKPPDDEGIYEMNLRLEGHDKEEEVDIVLVLDNSNSMAHIDESVTETRAVIAKRATEKFIDTFKNYDNVGISLITYGTEIFDGRNDFLYYLPGAWTIYSYGQSSAGAGSHGYVKKSSYYTATTPTSNMSEKNFQYSQIGKEALKNKIPSDVPNDRGQNDYGGTFTQKALREAEEIIQTSTASKKYIVLITDGMPTTSYMAKSVIDSPNNIVDYTNNSQLYDGKVIDEFSEDLSGNGIKYHLGEMISPINIIGNSTPRYIVNKHDTGGIYSVNLDVISMYPPDKLDFNYNGALADKQYDTIDGYTITDLGFPTISEAIAIRLNNSNLEIFSLGIGMKGGFVSDDPTIPAIAQDETTMDENINFMKNIAGSAMNYYPAEDVSLMDQRLEEIAKRIEYSIPNGKIIDPIGEKFDLSMKAGRISPVIKYPWTETSDPAYTDFDIEITVSNETYNEEMMLNLEQRIKAKYENNQIIIENISFLGDEDWLNINYKIKLKDSSEKDLFHQTNGRTYVIPDVDSTIQRELDYYVPSAKVSTSEPPPEPNLPNTGGMGDYIFYLIGLPLLIFSVLYKKNS